MKANSFYRVLPAMAVLPLLLTGCIAVGPKYTRPSTETVPAYKAAELGSWKEGQPLDNVPKGKWWTVFGDSDLNALQDQAAAQDQAWSHARRAYELARESFTLGITDYLDVIDADRAALQTRRTNMQLAGQRMNAVVQLIKALGGGWQSSSMTSDLARATYE